ncbi:SH3 domain-containing protein [Salibacterium salarium]|nr:SH3 domain-containing protein [Salibacterium salarium]
MGVAKPETYFKDAELEYNHIVRDVKTRLNERVAKEVIAFVNLQTDRAMSDVRANLYDRAEKLLQLDEAMPKNPDKEDIDHFVTRFFRLAAPGEISKELQQALNFENIETAYHDFIDGMAAGEYGEVFKRYKYPTAFFNGLCQAMLHHIPSLVDALQTYTDTLGNHAELIAAIRSEKQGQSFLKAGASVAGLAVGIPFLGAGLGKLMGNNAKEKLDESWSNVIKDWNAYVDRLDSFFDSLTRHYRLAMMTLYGGTIMRVNDQFRTGHLMIDDLDPLRRRYKLTLTAGERKETETWVKKTTHGIQTLVAYKQWQEAMKVAQDLFDIVKKQPVMARTALYDEKSTLYIAHLYYYLTYQEALLEEFKNGHYDHFYEKTKRLYEEMFLMVYTRNSGEMFSTSAALLFRFVKESLRRDKTDDLLVLADYFNQMSLRFQQQGGYPGEGSSKVIMQEETKPYDVVLAFLTDDLGFQIHLDTSKQRSKSAQKGQRLPRMSRKQWKKLIQIDEAIGPRDQFSAFLQANHVRSLLSPPSSATYQWISRHKKKVTAVVLGAVIGFGGYTYGEDIYQFGEEKISMLQSSDTEVSAGPETNTYMSITTEYANVRSDSSLNSSISFTVDQEDDLRYLEEEATDVEGRTWYLVEQTDGEEGWISGKIVQEISR